MGPSAAGSIVVPAVDRHAMGGPVVDDCEVQQLVKILLDEAQIRDGVRRLADAVTAEFGDQPLTIVGVLTGSVVLLADLIRLLEMPLRIDFVQAASYRGTQRGELTFNPELIPDIAGRHVLLVDDIFDTGHTLSEVRQQLEPLGPHTIRTAVLLRKAGQQLVDQPPDFVAFSIPNQFVVGYGLDYRDEFRHLPYLAVLEPIDLASDKP
jgi:hypoxanthine phosphoribosyltransferase